MIGAWRTVGALMLVLGDNAAMADCRTASAPIATDRPTVANSSAVVPARSLQLENGFGASVSSGATTWDLPETRARAGLGACTEFLLDLPDYTATGERGVFGWTSVAPAIKHQFDGLPDGLSLWGATGVAVGTGARKVAGRGPAPYVQLPWSFDLGGGWTMNGMYGATFHPDARGSAPDNQTTIFLDRTVGATADVFVEYVNDYQSGAPTLNRVSLGGSYRYSPTRQIDIKFGAGLNHASPDWYVTVGYSLRLDRLF